MTAQHYPEQSFTQPESQAIGAISYDLAPDEMKFMTARLVSENPMAAATDQDYVCFRVHGTSDYANIARTLEGDVFVRDLADDKGEIFEERAPYENSSWFLLVVDKKHMEAKGMLRIYEDSDAGFSALNDVEGDPTMTHATDTHVEVPFSTERFYADYGINPQTTWEVGTIAVLPESRRGAQEKNLHAVPVTREEQEAARKAAAAARDEGYIVSGLLYRGLYASAVDSNIEHFVSIIHTENPNDTQTVLRDDEHIPKAYETLRGLGIPFYEMYDMGPKRYENETWFQPAVATVADFGREMRGYVDWRIATAKALFDLIPSDDEAARKEGARAVKKAEDKRGMIEVLLTGLFLDDMFAQPHRISPEERTA